MDKIIEEIIDYSLLIAHSYLIIRLALSNSKYFKTPFFYFFIITGAFGSLSVIGFIIAVRFPIPEDRAWIFKMGYVLNTFCVTGSTICKVFIATHRYSVMSHVNMLEHVWSNRTKYALTVSMIFLSSCRCVSEFFCGYYFVIKDGVKLVSYVDDECTVVDKSKSAFIYFIYIIVSMTLTILTSRQLYKIQKRANTQTKKIIMKQQRKMFIIVSVCTISHLIKAIHQFFWVFVAYFHLTHFNVLLQSTYMYPHYLATYSASVTLIIVSPRVRSLLICRKYQEERSNGGTTPS